MTLRKRLLFLVQKVAFRFNALA
ncbi:MAG: hypothetical protein K0Q59_4238, partial [Paenibacillus sp.]|nr:hypothetical protein [Paenibacillus sp.]